MALSGSDKEEIERAVLRVTVEDFHHDYEQIYAFTQQILGKLPDRASEEIQNADNHKVKALAADNITAARINVARARRHVFYAKYLCLYQAINFELGYAADHITTFEAENGRYLGELRKQLLSMIRRREALVPFKIEEHDRIEDVEKDVDALISANRTLESLLGDSVTYVNSLKKNQAVTTAIRSAVVRKLNNIVKWVILNILWIGLFGVLVNLIAAGIYTLWAEDLIRAIKGDNHKPPAQSGSLEHPDKPLVLPQPQPANPSGSPNPGAPRQSKSPNSSGTSNSPPPIQPKPADPIPPDKSH